ncbi:N-acetyltransferase [Halobacillus andaensis]|uniref:N-acetyltransferase n=1 Tax=Halobacillus andaensis TaxID=1176239 RepID=A0A917EZA5_HALAA|nr:GNAT family protein [Halobacillus andaensis]MBP2006554.1 RimJ/RimL family protein N-acetyltransferase [Halobacillus andaensis]GGF28248.1 N-acetyltransferase [Halobacillus andaensis]
MKAILHSHRVHLGPVTDEHLEQIATWFNHSLFLRRFDAAAAQPRSYDSLKEWRDDATKNDSHFLFSICDGDTLIGYVELDGILWNQRNGWISIAIGDADHQGKGYGTEAMELLINYAFQELNLHRLQLTVFDYNEPALRLYEKLGFTYEGAQREFVLRDGKAYDMLMYGLLAREWNT